MALLVTGLIIFFAAHTFTMFRGARANLIDKLGEGPYKGLYPVVSLIGFVVPIFGYANAPRIGIWAPPLWMQHVTMVF